MKLYFSCTSCGKNYQIDHKWIGKRAHCKSCGMAMRVPDPPLEMGPVGGGGPKTDPQGGNQEAEIRAVDLEDAEVETARRAPSMAVVEAITTSPGRRRTTDMRMKNKKGAGWVAVTVAFVLGIVTGGAIIFLTQAMTPAPAAPMAPPTVDILVRFEGGSPPDAEVMQKHILETVTRELEKKGMRVTEKGDVRAIATIRKTRDIAVPLNEAAPHGSQPGVVHEEVLEADLAFHNAAGTVLDEVTAKGEMILEPEKLAVPTGTTLDEMIHAKQWTVAADKFGTMQYPTSDTVKRALGK